MVKSRLKLLAFVSLVLSSINSYACPCNQPQTSILNVGIPCLKPGVEFNVGAVWLRPGASNLNYVILNRELPAQSPTWREQEINPTFHSAFQMGVRATLPNPGQDISLNWTHLNTSDTDTTIAPDASWFLGPDYQIGPAGTAIRKAVGNVQFRYDVVNLDAGQYISFGKCFRMRFFGGLSTGFLREQVEAKYSGTTTPPFAGPFSTRQTVYSNFTGIGPRVGLSGEYDMNYGFGLLGEAGISALIGSSYTKTSYLSSAAELLALYGQTLNNQFINDKYVYQVVPGFDAKLGINYKYPCRCALITVSAGYQAAVYVNAISQYIPQTLVDGAPLQAGGIFVATMSHRLSNYSVQGPFLNLAVSI